MTDLNNRPAREAGDPPLLFTPIRLRSLTSRNRVMFSPMAMYSLEDGVPGDWHLVHLGARAVGGAGIVMAEASAVSPEGRVSLYDAGLWNDEQATGWRRITTFIKAQGAIAGIQLAHAGRKAAHTRPWESRLPLDRTEGGWAVTGPSPIPWSDGEPVPTEMTVSDIQQVVEDFRSATRRARDAGFELLEIHAAHGYLLHSFMSPTSNHRQDRYGGSIDNRARFLYELVERVREEWPEELPLFVRLSATDWLEAGWSIDDTIHVARGLRERGVDAVDCSSGGTSPAQKISAHPGYQLPFSQAVREATGMRTVGVGLIYEAEAAEEALVSGAADIVAIGRIGLWDPYWPIHAATPLGFEPPLPVQYARSAVHLRSAVTRARNTEAVQAHH